MGSTGGDVISHLVSGDMVRRELRDLNAFHGRTVARLMQGPEAAAGFSVRDRDGVVHLVALLDHNRKRITDVMRPIEETVPSSAYLELAHHVIETGLSVDGIENLCGLVRDSEGQLHSLFELPQDLDLSSPVVFHGPYAISLPRMLRSTSDFILMGMKFLAMPEHLEIRGNADFTECEFDGIPDRSTFHEDLSITSSTIQRLPRGLFVGRWLKMRGTSIDTLPGSIRVGVGIDAEDSGLRIVPPGFELAGDLRISGSSVRRLVGVRIGGSLYIERMVSPELADDCEIGGNIYADTFPCSLSGHLAGKTFVRTQFGYERPTPERDVGCVSPQDYDL